MGKLIGSPLIAGITGKVGNAVYVRTATGISVRDYVVPRDPQTPAQMASRMRMRLAAGHWRRLSYDQVLAWRDYGIRLGLTQNQEQLFFALALKFLQVNPPGSQPPALPPSSDFAGDAVTVTAEAAGRAVRFQASGANAEGVVTELLLQPVRSATSRHYPKKLRTQGFVAFGPSFVAPVPGPGWYVAAYRFVRVSTGQASGILLAGTVRVD